KFGGARNVIAVMADNTFTKETEMARIVATELPWNSPHWHPAHGGIYRNVYLHVTNPLHISLQLYSFLQPAGPYVYPVGHRFTVEGPLKNQRTSATKVEAVARVLDASGRSIAEWRQAVSLAAGASGQATLSGTVPNPQLWEPGHPYLYR